jgi:glycosyltransferase involved in cell wall biosynthesis
MALPEISVLMPVYKGDKAADFDLALQSVCTQNYPAKEIVVVQDGPLTPELNEVITKWQAKYPTIKPVVLAQNRGLSGALNAGIDAANYEWIARMDADDICKPNRLEKQAHYILEHPDLAIIGSWIDEYDEQMKEKTGVRRVPETHAEIRQYAKWRCPFNHMTVMYKTEAVRKLGKYRNYGAVGDDYELWARFLLNGYNAANIQEALVDARAGSDFFGNRRRGMKYLRNELKEVNDLYQMGLFNRGVWFFHVIMKSFVRLMPAPLVKGIYKLIRLSS